MIYTELVTYVRTLLDVDAEEVPDLLVREWAKDATHRIERARKQWPFYAHRWTLPIVAGEKTYDLASVEQSALERISSIHMVEDASTGRRLSAITREAASRMSSTATGSPTRWRVEDTTLFLYSTPAADGALTLHGFRKGARWFDGENSSTPDLPDEMVGVIQNWVVGRAYQQQEDPDMGVMYLDMANEELLQWVKRPPGGQHGDEPLVMGGSSRSSGPRFGSYRHSWE